MHLKDKILEKLRAWLDKLFASIIGGTPIDLDCSDDSDTKDEVSYSDLTFCWGGLKKKDTPIKATIGNLGIKGSGLKYSWISGGCEELGATSRTDYAATVACLFCRINGTWKGGKFDYISTSRTTRGFSNIFDGYNKWEKDAIYKADAYAFVIVSLKQASRTNVIMCKAADTRDSSILGVLRDLFSWLIPTVESRRRKRDELMARIKRLREIQSEALQEGRMTDAAANGQQIATLYKQLGRLGWFSSLLLCLMLSGCAEVTPELHQPAVIGERLFLVKPEATLTVPKLLPPARKWYLVDDVGLCQWLGIPPEDM